MTLTLATHLTNRSLIRIGGDDRVAFLQGLVSNDVTRADQGIYAALLTPQGKFLHDLFILDCTDFFLIDCEAARADDLLRRLTAHKLRSKVTFENLVSDYDVWSLLIAPSLAGGARESHRQTESAVDAPCEGTAKQISFIDPRLPELGRRIFTPKNTPPSNTTPANFPSYDFLRLTLGIADGSRDMEIEKSTLAEGNFDFLSGIDWKKGCYMGQELTARVHYRGLTKKRLFPVRIEGPSPEFGVVLSLGGQEVGEMRSHNGNLGLALLKAEAVQSSLARQMPLTNAETKLFPFVPAWMKIDAPTIKS